MPINILEVLKYFNKRFYLLLLLLGTVINDADIYDDVITEKRKALMLSDCNGTRTYNHLVHKRTLNHLAKILAKWLCVRL